MAKEGDSLARYLVESVKTESIKIIQQALEGIPGGAFPWRWKIRPQGFINLQILPRLVKRMKLADIMTILGSIDIIMGEGINSFLIGILKGGLWSYMVACPYFYSCIGNHDRNTSYCVVRKKNILGYNNVLDRIRGSFGNSSSSSRRDKITFFKEDLLPSRGDILLFKSRTLYSWAISILLSYSPISSIGVFLWISISSIAPIGLLMSGYGSNNKYFFWVVYELSAQSISYEIPLTPCVLSISLGAIRWGMNF
ncbi:hypothetical protein MKW92_011307 [Papaver armeniacum]|nr:hypothetical protein MKW92_011307 [Papaver armeniacum]